MTTIIVQTPRGTDVTLHYREGTTDLATIGSTFRLWGNLVDEYGLADIHSDGLLIDVGAHIGTVAIAFLVDNPTARAVAVEPLPENVAQLRENASSAGVDDRLSIVEAAIGSERVGYGPDVHRFIGNIGTLGRKSFVPPVDGISVATVTLSDIIEWSGAPDIVKTDCEGGEWSLFTDPAIVSVPLIMGEYHHKGARALRKALSASHDVTCGSGATGNFRAVLR